MARVAFTDFSAIGDIRKKDPLIRTHLFVDTSASLDESVCDFPTTAVVINGVSIEFGATLTQLEVGWNLDVDVFEETLSPSSSFAEFYFNLVFDVAAMRHASAFILSSRRNPSKQHSYIGNVIPLASAVISAEDLVVASQLACLLYTFEPYLLRTLGWYRRGLSSPDIFLSFLALWNSIETASATFSVKNEKTVKGSKNQIYQTMADYLPNNEAKFYQPEMNDLGAWIDKYYDRRKDIAHGLAAVNPTTFEDTEKMLPKLRHVSTALLRVLTERRCKENEKIVAVLKQAKENKLQWEEMQKTALNTTG